MFLDCYKIYDVAPDLVPARSNRDWMDAFTDRHPYRCLPLTMANTTGWDILCPVGFTATWDGGAHQECIKFQPDHPYPGFHDFVKSHFTRGVVTFHTGYLFRTPPGWSLMAMGPPNHVKDGIQPLAGVIETDWLPFPFTMNWIFTRPGTVRFEKGETFCFIMLIQDKPMEAFQPVIRSMNSNPELRRQYDVWAEKRTEFNNLIFKRDPEATKEAWQRFYFKGEYPEEIQAEAPSHHVNKRRMKSPKLGV